VSLYANFLKERIGKDILEDDKSYVTFCGYRDGIIVEDVYVAPEHRKQGLAIKRIYDVVELCKQHSIKKIYICVSTQHKHSTMHESPTNMTRALINHGCVVDHLIAPHAIILSKEI
jgi:GNAT superfamily N-acetyltransferase